jgi:hypothetical protein
MPATRFDGTVRGGIHAAEESFVYVGPISDGGWSYQHNLGHLAREKQFGARIKTTYVESVPETADAERVIRQLAAKGYDVRASTATCRSSLQRLRPSGCVKISGPNPLSPGWPANPR